MAVQTITYTDKLTGSQVTAADMNEIKTVVNNNGSKVTIYEVDTTSADVDVSSYFSSGVQGDIIQIVNIGTGGYHALTGIDDIDLGTFYDGTTYEPLSITFTYGDTGWRYDDCLIDYYKDTGTDGTQYVSKWSKGKMKISVIRSIVFSSETLKSVAVTLAETFITIEDCHCSEFVNIPSVTWIHIGINYNVTSGNTTSVIAYVYSGASVSGTTDNFTIGIEGLWRAAA